jgi:exopolyphosphatase/guanosine-5'-triphosphate,3'-diphosphate pyrophosphatase
MQARYHVDIAQASRVEATALALWRQTRHAGAKCNPLAESSLRWAARLHEIGLDVAHSGYHRHGAYLLENADMPGFARDEQVLLARLVRFHRRKFEREGREDPALPRDRMTERLILVLRLAVLLHRNRGDAPPPRIALIIRGRVVTARFQLRSLRRHPLTEADLHSEQHLLKAGGLTLRIALR